LLPILEQLLFGESPLHERTRINPRRDMALHVDQIAAVILRRRMPEMTEAYIVEKRRRLKARDVTAELGRLLVGAQNDRDRVPADCRADLVLELTIPGRL